MGDGLLPIGGFAGPSAEDRSPNVSVERTVNLYAARPSGTAAVEWVLRRWPGLIERVATIGRMRGLLAADDRMFGVAGTQLIEFEPGTNGALSTSGSDLDVIADDGRPVDLITNSEAGRQLLIRGGTSGYLFDLDAVTTVVSSISSFPAARSVTWCDTYGLALSATTPTIYASNPGDLSTWDAGNAQQRSTAADTTVAIHAVNREVIVLGATTSEVWWNAGEAGFPFVPREGVFIEAGCAAPATVKKFRGSVVWLGQSEHGGLGVFGLQGWTPVRLSTPAHEAVWREYARIDDAEAFSMTWDGHDWYVLTFPEADTTWVFDGTTNLWHERLKWDSSQGRYRAFSAACHAYAFGRHYVSERKTGQSGLGIVEELSATAYEDGGQIFASSPLRWLRRLPHITKHRDRLTYDCVQLDMETGVGLSSGQGEDPQVMMRYSKDDGHTWSNEKWRSAGLRGKYGTRVQWRQLGRSRARTFEFAGSDPVPITLLNALVRVRT